MKKEYFVNKESVEKLYKIAYDYCARKDLEGLKKSFEETPISVNQTNEQNGWTLLMTASYLDFYMAVDFLIKQGANIDMVEKSGATALLGAVSNDSLSCAQKLLKAGANVNLGNSQGFTPLMSACYNGNQQMVEIILGKNPEIMQKDKQGKTALEYALDSDNFSVVNIIEKIVIEKKIALKPNQQKVVMKI